VGELSGADARFMIGEELERVAPDLKQHQHDELSYVEPLWLRVLRWIVE
jgi:hypothetical protein